MAKILLIEDNDLVRGLLSVTLTESGFEVVEAVTAEAGLSQARTHHPDLIILDLYLEGSELGGLETLAVIRSTKSLSQTPVVIISGKAKAKELEKAIQLGIGSFLAKPFKPSELLEVIEQLLQAPDDTIQAAEANG